jgi:hypothetical protein
MKRVFAVLGIVAACLTGSALAAPLSLSLSSPNNLLGLSPGDIAVINVNLTGLGTGEQLVSLTGSIRFPGLLLGTPLSLRQGLIVPDAADFLGSPLAGQADAMFLTFSSDPTRRISQNGLFYSFTVQAQAVGSGELALAPLALMAEQYDPQNPLLPVLRTVSAGAALPFDLSSPAVIPAPPALGLALLGLALVRRKFRPRMS